MRTLLFCAVLTDVDVPRPRQSLSCPGQDSGDYGGVVGLDRPRFSTGWGGRVTFHGLKVRRDRHTETDLAAGAAAARALSSCL